eukprot:g9042.t1
MSELSNHQQLSLLQTEVGASLIEHAGFLEELHRKEDMLAECAERLKSMSRQATTPEHRAFTSTAAFLSAANRALRHNSLQELLEQRRLSLLLSNLTQEEQSEVLWVLDHFSAFPRKFTTDPFNGCFPGEHVLASWTAPFAEASNAPAHLKLSQIDQTQANAVRSISYPHTVQGVVDVLLSLFALPQQVKQQLPKSFATRTEGQQGETSVEQAARCTLPACAPPYEFDEDDSPNNIVMDGDKIKCATLNKLIERVTDEKHTDLTTRYVFLLTHLSFTDSLEVLSKLERRFEVPLPPNLSLEEVEKFKKHKIEKVQIRVCSVIKNWLEEHWEADWADNEELVVRLTSLIKSMQANSVSSATDLLAKTLANLLVRKQNSQDKKMFRTAKFPKPLIANTSFFSFERTNEEEFARQLTLKDWERFHAIKPRECLNCNWSKSNKEVLAPNILAMINQFNLVTCWVQHTIVCEPNLQKRGLLYNKMLKKRGLLYNKMLKIADHCRSLNNFNSLFAIYCGLTANPVHRLKKTKELVTAKGQKKFLEYKELFKGDKNCRNLRNVLGTTPTPCIPHLGIFLTDLTFTEDGNPDMIGNMINFDKRCKLAERIRWIKQYQQEGYQLAKVDVVHAYFTSHFRVIDPDTLWELSRKNEPKEPT